MKSSGRWGSCEKLPCVAGSPKVRTTLRVSLGSPTRSNIFLRHFYVNIPNSASDGWESHRHPRAAQKTSFDTSNADWHMTGHSAIVDPTAEPGAPKRESFEVSRVVLVGHRRGGDERENDHDNRNNRKAAQRGAVKSLSLHAAIFAYTSQSLRDW